MADSQSVLISVPKSEHLKSFEAKSEAGATTVKHVTSGI
jgi:hypothetical protein